MIYFRRICTIPIVLKLQFRKVIHGIEHFFNKKWISLCITTESPQTYPQNLEDIYKKTVDKVHI